MIRKSEKTKIGYLIYSRKAKALEIRMSVSILNVQLLPKNVVNTWKVAP